MAFGSGAKKLGQPVLLSYFVSDENSGRSQPAQANVPLRFSSLSGLEPAGSVRCRRSTSYCALVRIARHSLSLFWISKLPAASTSVLHSARSPAISASAPAPVSKRRRSVMVSVLLAPQFLEPGVASAIEAIEFVADGILHVVILMVLFGFVERAGRHDCGLDRLLEAFRNRRLRGFRQRALLVAVIEDRAAVLVAVVAELPILGQRIDVVPEHVEQLLIAHLGRVVHDLHCFGVAGAAV